MKCDVCGQDRPGKRVDLTAEEQALYLKQGAEAKEAYFYCHPCWRILSNPERGPLLMRGLFERQLRAAGVPNPGEMADKYYRKLKELQRSSTHGKTV